MSEWISVDDKPLPDRLVLVWYDGDYEIGMMINGKPHVFFDSNPILDICNRITHWMPLPAPPKGE